MPRQKLSLLVLIVLASSLSYCAGYVRAYDQTVYNNLFKTRDALIDQRTHLEEKADEIKKKMAELDRQLDVVNSYLRDTDRSLRNIEDAIKRVQ
ncbi:MAG: hypothetical protein IPM23_16890 [Candidatus Melainabacteria bacterium]|nr:hypothetical protein [Candidatus Melainabacteria bacterium]